MGCGHESTPSGASRRCRECLPRSRSRTPVQPVSTGWVIPGVTGSGAVPVAAVSRPSWKVGCEDPSDPVIVSRFPIAGARSGSLATGEHRIRPCVTGVTTAAAGPGVRRAQAAETASRTTRGERPGPGGDRLLRPCGYRDDAGDVPSFRLWSMIRGTRAESRGARRPWPCGWLSCPRGRVARGNPAAYAPPLAVAGPPRRV